MAKRSSRKRRKGRKFSGEAESKPRIKPRDHVVLDFQSPGSALALVHFNVTWDSLPDPILDNAPEAIRCRVEDLYRTLKEDLDPRKAIKELTELIDELPGHRPLRNWLINVYESTGEEELARKLAEELLEEHPDYFFARTKVATMCMDLQHLDLERAEVLLGGKYKVPQSIAPGRDLFHVTEVTTYFLAVARFFCCRADRKSVEIYRNLIVELCGEDCAEVEIIDHMLKPQSWMMFKMLAGLTRLSDEAA